MKGSIATLVNVTILWVSGYSFYHFPQLFEAMIIEKFKVTTVDVSYLYSVSFFPNIFSNILAGILIDRFGLGISNLLFVALEFYGVLLVYIGFYLNNFDYVITGRLIFGAGFETTFLAQTVAAEKYFPAKYLTLIYSLNRSVSYLFGSLSNYLQPLVLYKYRSMEPVLLIYGLINIISFSGALYIAFQELLLKKNKQENQSGKEPELRKFGFRDFKLISSRTWILVVTLTFDAQAFQQFLFFASDFMMKRLNLEYLQVKNVLSTLPLNNMILIPIFSVILGNYGKKSLGLLIAGLMLASTYFFMINLSQHPPLWQAYLIIFGGCSFWSLYTSSVWSSVLISLPKQASAFMVGLCTSIQSVAYSTIPPIFGIINEERTSAAYQKSAWVLFFMAIGVCLLAILLIIVDFRNGKLLYLCEKDPKVELMREEMIREFEEFGENGNDDYKSLGLSEKRKENLVEEDDMD